MLIYNYPKQNVSFEALKYKNCSGINIPSTFKVNLTDDFGDKIDCFVKHKIINNPRFNDYSISITNDENTEIGHCLFDYLDYGMFHISAINNYSNRLKGVGSVLHLTEIISMLENNAKETQLYSVGSAINFHARFGYKSDIQTLSEIKSFLIEEIELKYAENKMFSGIIKKNHNWFADKKTPDTEKIKNGNKIIDEFIQFINENDLRYPDVHNIKKGINMRLTREDVLKNKEYYNNLLSKFNIDYHINN